MSKMQKRLDHLPVKVDDLSRWILIGKVKLKAQIAAIKAINKLEEGVAAHAAALSDTQDLAEELLYAEARMGDMLKAIPEKKASSGGGTRSLPKGIDKKQSHYAQELSRNEDTIAEVVANAREPGEVPVRQHVLEAIKNPGWYQQSKSDKWPTPQWLFDLLDKEFHFQTDVCASEDNAKCKKYYTKEDDGLSQVWRGTCWCNPPYGREIAAWMAKARESAEHSATVVCLVPARPDTDWWWTNALCGEVRFIRGRLKWPGSETAAPFPSAVVVLKKDVVPKKVIWWDVSRNN